MKDVHESRNLPRKNPSKDRGWSQSDAIFQFVSLSARSFAFDIFERTGPYSVRFRFWTFIETVFFLSSGRYVYSNRTDDTEKTLQSLSCKNEFRSKFSSNRNWVKHQNKVQIGADSWVWLWIRMYNIIVFFLEGVRMMMRMILFLPQMDVWMIYTSDCDACVCADAMVSDVVVAVAALFSKYK